jgi:hypothetical protein
LSPLSKSSASRRRETTIAIFETLLETFAFLLGLLERLAETGDFGA